MPEVGAIEKKVCDFVEHTHKVWWFSEAIKDTLLAKLAHRPIYTDTWLLCEDTGRRIERVLDDGDGNSTGIHTFAKLVSSAKSFTADSSDGPHPDEEALPVMESKQEKRKMATNPIRSHQELIVSDIVVDGPHTQRLLQNIYDFLHDLQLKVCYAQDIPLTSYEKFLHLLSNKYSTIEEDLFPFLFSLVIAVLRQTLQESDYDSKFLARIPIEAFLSYFSSQFIRDILYPQLACLKKTGYLWIEEDESKFVDLVMFHPDQDISSKSLWKEESAPSVMIYNALMTYKKNIISSTKTELPTPIFRFSLNGALKKKPL